MSSTTIRHEDGVGTGYVRTDGGYSPSAGFQRTAYYYPCVERPDGRVVYMLESRWRDDAERSVHAYFDDPDFRASVDAHHDHPRGFVA